MTISTVTYTGDEVAIVAGLIAACLPALDPADYEVADLMLDRAIAAMNPPLAPDIEARLILLRAKGLRS